MNNEQQQVPAVGRYESEDYPEGYRGDYLIVTDAVDRALESFILEDDIAEPAIYAEAIERAGSWIENVRRRVEEQIADTNEGSTTLKGGDCVLCHRKVRAPGDHEETCPMMSFYDDWSEGAEDGQ